MKQRILSVAVALCLCISSQSVAYAGQEAPSLQEDILTEEPTSRLAARDGTIPTPSEAYEAMIALKDQDAYKEGTTWTNDEPYSDATGNYKWKGGPLGGVNIVAAGCVAFAFTLSDAAFGSLQARMYAAGEFSFEDIKVGDILRVNNDAHTVIVLNVSEVGVLIAEGNYSVNGQKGTVHWGRTISKAEVMSSTSHYITRYPEGYIPNDPEANVSIGSGTLGELTWNLTKGGTLTISGKGAMPDFINYEEQPWSNNRSKIWKVVLEDGVTSIGSSAFYKCGILSADIPSSITSIGNNAFRESSIISVTVPSSVKTIGDNAFRACASLTSIALPASIEEVGAGAFFDCRAMEKATFAPSSKQVKMGDNLFTECYELTSVTLPQNIDCISEGMFQNCLILTKVEIPQGAESIGGSAFASCSRLASVVIPDSVTTIGIAAFSACSSLKNIYFTGNETQWNSIRKIGDTASTLANVEIQYNYIPPIDTNPDDSNNNGGNSGSSGTGNGSSDNDGSSGDNGTGNDGSSGGNGTGNDGSSGGNGTGNDGSSGDNSGGDNNSGNNESQTPKPLAKGKTFTVSKITYKVTKAGKEVELASSKSTAKKITIHTVTGTDGVKYKVTSIGPKAMRNNKKITSLTIGPNVKKIGANAFSGCTKLTTVSFGKNVTTIGASSFKGCSALKKTLTLPDSVKTIGASSFSGCNNITAVTIGKTSKSNLTTIGKSAFNGCKKLSKVTLKSTKLKSVGNQAFKGTKSSLKVKVPSKQLAKYKNLLKKAGLKSKQITK